MQGRCQSADQRRPSLSYKGGLVGGASLFNGEKRHTDNLRRSRSETAKRPALTRRYRSRAPQSGTERLGREWGNDQRKGERADGCVWRNGCGGRERMRRKEG